MPKNFNQFIVLNLCHSLSTSIDAWKELYCIALYSFIVQVDRTQPILHTNSFPTSCFYKVHVFGYTKYNRLKLLYTITSYGNIIVTVRRQIQLVEVILFSLRLQS